MVHVGGLRGEGADPETSVLSQMLMMSNVLAGENLPNVVWSLSYEMIFYLLLTALFMARVHRRSNRYALAFGAAAVVLGGLLPQAYFTSNLWSPRIIALIADLVVLTGLAFAVALRGMPRLVGAALAAMVGLTLLAFNGTWLFPWEALSILALMFTGTMLYRAEQGQYSWRKAIAIAVAVLGLAIAAGVWHHNPGNMSAHDQFVWERTWFMSVFVAGLTFGIGLALRHVTWPRILTWLGLISYSIYLLHPALIEVFRHLNWTSHHSFWIQVLLDALVRGHPDRGVLGDLPARGAAHAGGRPSAGSPARCPVRSRPRPSPDARPGTRPGSRLPRRRIGRAAASWCHGSTVAQAVRAQAVRARVARGAAAAAA